MDINDITTLIGTVGFPIVAFLLMFWRDVKESRATREAVESNTIAITQLVEFFKKEV